MVKKDLKQFSKKTNANEKNKGKFNKKQLFNKNKKSESKSSGN